MYPQICSFVCLASDVQSLQFPKHQCFHCKKNVGTRRGLFRRRTVPASEPQWMIWYVLADDDGNVDEHNWDNFMFSGRSVFSLMARVAFREGHRDANHFVLCVKAGHDARRTPLVIDLLPSQVQPMNIVALTKGSPGEN